MDHKQIFQIARQEYEQELREKPNYHDGKPRPAWNELTPLIQFHRAKLIRQREEVKT